LSVSTETGAHKLVYEKLESHWHWINNVAHTPRWLLVAFTFVHIQKAHSYVVLVLLLPNCVQLMRMSRISAACGRSEVWALRLYTRRYCGSRSTYLLEQPQQVTVISTFELINKLILNLTMHLRHCTESMTTLNKQNK